MIGCVSSIPETFIPLASDSNLGSQSFSRLHISLVRANDKKSRSTGSHSSLMYIESGSGQSIGWLVGGERTVCLVTFLPRVQSGRSITPASYIIKPLWHIDWDVLASELLMSGTLRPQGVSPLCPLWSPSLSGHWARSLRLVIV